MSSTLSFNHAVTFSRNGAESREYQLLDYVPLFYFADFLLGYNRKRKKGKKEGRKISKFEIQCTVRQWIRFHENPMSSFLSSWMKAKYAILERAITKYEDWKIVKFEIRIPKRGQRFSQILRAGISPGNNNAPATRASYFPPNIYSRAPYI